MIRKLSFLVGFGAGYVLGAKAGEGRYQQIVAKGRELAGMPAVQEATSTLGSAASSVAASAADKARSTVDDVVDLASGSSNGTTGSSTAPMAGAAASGSAPDRPAR